MADIEQIKVGRSFSVTQRKNLGERLAIPQTEARAAALAGATKGPFIDEPRFRAGTVPVEPRHILNP